MAGKTVFDSLVQVGLLVVALEIGYLLSAGLYHLGALHRRDRDGSSEAAQKLRAFRTGPRSGRM